MIIFVGRKKDAAQLANDLKVIDFVFCFVRFNSFSNNNKGVAISSRLLARRYDVASTPSNESEIEKTNRRLRKHGLKSG